jgi:hypothetical protein
VQEDQVTIPFVLTSGERHAHLIQMDEIAKSLVPKSAKESIIGRVEHPISFENAAATMFAVSTQQTCILTKRDATVGLGFESVAQRKKRREAAKPQPPEAPLAVATAKALLDDGDDEVSTVSEILDPLCEISFQHLINKVGEDYENTGNGYIEVIRDGTEIVALWHYFAPSVFKFLEGGTSGDYHYEVNAPSGTTKFARFGDIEGFLKRNPSLQQTRITEMIPFKMPTACHDHYGLPQWLGCTVWLELAQHLMSFEHDYYKNRAVPDLLVLVKGRQIPADAWTKIKEAVQGLAGPGNRHKTLTLNIPFADVEVQIERLNAEIREKIAESWPTVELGIVSAHRVPPLLAGIVTPGKMAAANELPNALVAFQTLYVAQHQRIFEAVLGNTLGGSENGVSGLTKTDFLLRRITDFYDMGQLDTMARMKQPVTGSARNLQQGLKE